VKHSGSAYSAKADMSAWLESWRDRVRAAQATSNSAALLALYAELVTSMGDEQASHVWLKEMSGWDASAITG
jgi:hypothetical protein